MSGEVDYSHPKPSIYIAESMCKSDTIIIKLEIVNSLLNTLEMHRCNIDICMYVYGSQIKILQDMNQI